MIKRIWCAIPLIVLFIGIFLSGCVGPQGGDNVLPNISVKGMVYYDESGQYWGITDENNKGYKPDSLDTNFQKNGLKVQINAQLLSNPKMSGNRGIPIRIIDITEIPDAVATVPGQLVGRGTMKSLPFEGGFYGIVGDNDQKYYPLQPVPDIFNKDGTPVIYTIEIRNDVTSTVMWGTPVDVIELGSLPEPSEYIYGTGTIVFLDYEKTKYGFLSDAIKVSGKQQIDPGSIPDQFKKDGMKVKYLVKVNPSSEDSQFINGELVSLEPA